MVVAKAADQCEAISSYTGMLVRFVGDAVVQIGYITHTRGVGGYPAHGIDLLTPLMLV